MPTILINLTEDSRRRVFPNDEFNTLNTVGEIVRFDPKADDASVFPRLLAEADAVLTCWGSRAVTADAWQERDRPLLVAHAAGSVRGVVPREMLTRGVRLTQSAAPMAIAVAQFAVGLMILALRQTLARGAALRAGGDYTDPFPARDLTGLTVGLVGLSQVGRRMPPLLAPFGCHVIAYDPYWSVEDASALGVELVSDREELIRRSDALSLHAPVTAETRNLLDARLIALLRPGTAVINTARPQIVDQDALFARAIAGDIQVYVDVTEPEPLPPSHAAFNSPNIFIAPHIAGLSEQGYRRIGQNALDEIARFLRGEPLQTEVTAERYDILA